MNKKKSVGISFDSKILQKIDEERGDISRSKFILKILKKIYNKETKTVTSNTKKEGKENLIESIN